MAEQDDEKESYEHLTNELEEVIKLMQSHMGRFPTEDEVIGFVWGSEDVREAILAKK